MHTILKYITSILVVATAFVTHASAQTIEQPILNLLDGAKGQLHKDSSVTIEDDKWWTPVEQAKLNLTGVYSVKNIISLKINEDTNVVLGPKFTVTVHLQLYITAPDGTVDASQTPFLSITYDTATGAVYNSQSILTFNNGYRVKAKILGIDSSFTPSGANTLVTPFLRLENEMQITREYNYSCSAASSGGITFDGDRIDGSDEVLVAWSSLQGATEFDLEWAYVDKESLADPDLYRNPDNSLNPKKIFTDNATRVSVQTTSYKIPLLYDTAGTLFVRYRPVQQRPGGRRYEGHWSSDYSGGMPSYEYFLGHENQLNWQATTSFAEEGKRKSVVQYYDGSLRSRQTVTKDNTTGKTVVAETFYDYQGRPVIQVLPAPTLNTMIGYTKNFNRGINASTGESIAYDKSLYDTLNDPTDYCLRPAPPMHTDSSGAAMYYSSSNPEAGLGFNKYIPDAHGYAFTETRYMQDNTGRVLSQSGVDSFYKIGSGHETKYYYGNPSQEELDGLFGTEVGYASHYFKNMVRDANGQYSVSYVDMHGRTIATALAGEAPASLQPLKSDTSFSVTEKLADSTNNITRDLVMESSRSILVPVQAPYIFHYALNPDSIRILSCKDSVICYDCLYNLEISITDECNNCHLPGNKPYIIADSNFTFAHIDTTCGAVAFFDRLDTLVLAEGNYTITKKLSVSRYALDYYRDSVFAKKNTCRTFNDFYHQQLTAIGNGMTCDNGTCEECTAHTSSIDAFRTYYLGLAGIPEADSASWRDLINQAFVEAKEECALTCGNDGEDMYIRKMMLLDMTAPFGQYANPDSASNANNYGNIFDPSTDYWRSVVYHDEYGKPDSIVNSLGILVPPGSTSISQPEFIANFKESWAIDLLSHHPEYDKLIRFESFHDSHLWDEQFGIVDTYAEADSKGYLNPVGFTTPDPVPSHFNYSSGNLDPLTATGKPLRTPMRTAVYSFDVESGHTFSMWGAASIVGNCPDKSCSNTYDNAHLNNCLNAFCTGALDMGWRAFRQMYLNRKRYELMYYLNAEFASVHSSIPAYHVEYFAVTDPGSDAYLSSITGQDANTIQAGVNSQLQGFYHDNCEAFATDWWTKLEPCFYNVSDTARRRQDSLRLIPRMVEICTAGSDGNHQFGSSSAPASSLAYKSFDDLLKHYMDSMHVYYPTEYNYNAYCNGGLIYGPMPYDQQQASVQIPLWTKPDSCQCDRITTLYNQYKQYGVTDTSFSGYLYHHTGTQISDADLLKLRNMCNKVDTCKFLVTPIYLPPVLQCEITDVCVTCQQVQSTYDSFKVKFPGILPAFEADDSLQLLKNTSFANFMNHKFGFSKTATDYLYFMQTCNGASFDTSRCDSLKNILTFYKNNLFNVDTVHLDSGNCDTTHIKVSTTNNEYHTGGKLSNWIRDGIFQNPVGDTLNFSPNFIYKDTLCYDSVFTMESRQRFPVTQAAYDHWWNDPTSPRASYGWYGSVMSAFRFDNNKEVDFWVTNGSYWPGMSSPNLVLFVVLQENGSLIYNSYDIVTGVPNGNDWMNIKIRVQGTEVKAYFNNGLVATSNFTTAPSQFQMLQQEAAGQEFQVDWWKMYDKNGAVKYFEDFLGCGSQSAQTIPHCSNDCQTGFTTYYNSLHGTSYSFHQVDSIYFNTCGIHPDPCTKTLDYVDTSGINCNKLDSLRKIFFQTVINPASRKVDLDMRTFAGNITPPEGPKGVFNINGKLIGNTTGSSVSDINNSFASVWNTDKSNQQVGTLSALTSGKFRLSLKPGMFTPCNGIIGMRYYQVDNPDDTIDAVITGLGTYIDFGDGHGVRVDSAYAGDSTSIYLYNGGMYTSDWPFYAVAHAYASATPRTITIYHTDINGLLGFDNYFPGENAAQLPHLSNLRGYAPKQIYTLDFHSTQDSSVNTFDGFINKSEINGLQAISFIAGDGVTAFKSYNFGNLKQFHDLKQVWVNEQNLSPRALDLMLPNIAVNFPKLQLTSFQGLAYPAPAAVNFNLKDFRGSAFWFADSILVDTLINQISRTARDSGTLAFFGGGHRTTSSNAAIATLASKHWYINTGDTLIPQSVFPAHDTLYNLKQHYPATDMFTDFMNNAMRTNLDYYQLRAFYDSTCDHPLITCSADLTGALLCGKSEPLFPPITIPEDNPCADSSQLAFVKATEIYHNYQDSLKGAFDSVYLKKCMQAFKSEVFTVTHPQHEYHYTLYYYDQSGNLVKTVPPEGVDISHINNSTWLSTTATARRNGTFQVPSHGLQTNYRYNTLNQVVQQLTPDAGLSRFWYDRLARLVISQNAKQRAVPKVESVPRYSYTKYDVLGRITEVGQLSNATDSLTQTISQNITSFASWFNAATNGNLNIAEVTRTVYDNKYAGFVTTDPLAAVNLRNRVAYTTYTDGNSTTNYNQATFYSYDIHGNVDTLVQDYGSSLVAESKNVMNANGNRWKKLVYNYDLISGKVNNVAYQPNQQDAFYHRYTYDAENRLTLAETSADSTVWEKDARYSYYRHGPLARTVTGQLQVQGTDYAYTLQGWLKGVNSSSLQPGNDIGSDGLSTSSATKFIGRDAYGFSLNYFAGDYKSINSGVLPFPGSSAYLGSQYRELYNGNISSMVVNIPKLTTDTSSAMLYNYTYDQLNRITGMDAYRAGNALIASNSFSNLYSTNAYKERVAYDANGNILKYLRNGTAALPEMDSLNYSYNYSSGKLQNNRLRRVTDSIPVGNYTEDIDNQTNADNYNYDEIGNLIEDKAEGITQVDWNVYGKIKDVYKNKSGDPVSEILYSYDASGNRISKRVKKTVSGVGSYTTTWYVRDASGNVMGTYSNTGADTINNTLTEDEVYLYGSSRIGSLKVTRDVKATAQVSDTPYIAIGGHKIPFVRGNKQYELTNHLGNVLVTISDKKIGHDAGSGVVDYYDADIITANDYYPFGMIMPGRKYAAGIAYRYAFNDKEKDEEANGEGNFYDYGFRIYNPRLGRFLSVDPLSPKYPWYTPYQFAGDNPILNIDLDGLEDCDYNLFLRGLKSGYTKLINIPFPIASSTIINGKTVAVGTWKLNTNNPFWALKNGNEFHLKKGMSPGDAIEYFADNTSGATIDCAQFVQIELLYAMYKAMGKKEFDKYIKLQDKGKFILKTNGSTGVNPSAIYERGAKGTFTINKGGKIETIKEDDLYKQLPIGSRLGIQCDGYEVNVFNGENIIKVGEDQYNAQGIGTNMSLKDIKKVLGEKQTPKKGQKQNIYVRQVATFKINLTNKP